MSRAYFLFLLIGIIFVVFGYWPTAPVMYEVPKIDMILRWIELIFLVGIGTNFTQLQEKKLEKKLVVLILLFGGTAFFSSIFGVDFTKSIFGNYYRNDGLITLFHLIGFSFFIGLFWKASWQKVFSMVVVISNTLLSVWIITDWIRYFVFLDKSVIVWPNGGIGGPFGNPIFLAGYLIVTFPFTIYLLKELRWKFLAFSLLALLLQCVALLFTNTSTSLLGIVLVPFIYMCMRLGPIKRTIMLLLTGVCVITLLVISFQITSQKIDRESFVAESRPRIYMKTFLGALKRPIFGWGWANVDYAFDSSQWPIVIKENDKYVDKAHNSFLEVFATTGIVGLGLYVLILVFVFLNLTRFYSANRTTWNKTLLVICILYIIHSQTNVVSISEEMFFWFIVGQSLSLPSMTPKKKMHHNRKHKASDV